MDNGFSISGSNVPTGAYFQGQVATSVTIFFYVTGKVLVPLPLPDVGCLYVPGEGDSQLNQQHRGGGGGGRGQAGRTGFEPVHQATKVSVRVVHDL